MRLRSVGHLTTLLRQMPFLPSEERARLLLISYGGWFGGPVVRLDEQVLDGRMRLAAWHALCFKGDPPTIRSHDQRDAARLLLLAGHVRRAHDLLGDSIFYTIDTAALLRVPPEVGAELVSFAKRRHRKRPRQRRALDVVRRLKQLYLDCVQGCHELTPADLREILQDWS